ncbi:hypothetical protein B0H14DRAFT_3124570 [Mycena olivaceomarginata]|nr:hypothetical protein B0H14DRAFT_3124570 [Mycena olivaceomarginata]
MAQAAAGQPPHASSSAILPEHELCAAEHRVPHPGAAGPRPACIPVPAIADVEVASARGWRRMSEGVRRPREEAVSPAADAVLPPVDPVVKDDNELPPVESPAGVHAAEAERDPYDDTLLMAVSEEEYRLSPASPSPAPESEDDSVPPVAVAEVVFVHIEPVVAPAPTAQPPSLAWGGDAITAACIRSRAPPAAKMSFKEWQARRKLEHAAKEEESEQDSERGREKQREREREQERGREREREQERERDEDGHGTDKESEVVPCDGKHRPWSSMCTRTSRCPSLLIIDEPPISASNNSQPKSKGTPLSTAAFVATGNENLSPLAVPSVVDLRMPSLMQADAHRWNQARDVTSTRPRCDLSRRAHLTSARPSPAIVASPSVLHSPKAPRYPSPSFTSNCIPQPTRSTSLRPNLHPRVPAPRPRKGARVILRGRGLQSSSHSSTASAPLRIAAAHAADVCLCHIDRPPDAAALAPARAHATEGGVTERTQGASRGAEPQRDRWCLGGPARAAAHHVPMVWVRRRCPRWETKGWLKISRDQTYRTMAVGGFQYTWAPDNQYINLCSGPTSKFLGRISRGEDTVVRLVELTTDAIQLGLQDTPIVVAVLLQCGHNID